MKLLTLLFLFAAVHCSAAPGIDYRVKGSIKNYPSGWIYILFPDANGSLMGKIDSAKVTDGKFVFSGTTERASMVMVRLKNQKVWNGRGFFIDHGEIIADIEDDKGNLRIKAHGTKAQDLLNSFEAQVLPLSSRGNQAYGAKLGAEKKKDKKKTDSLDAVISSASKDITDLAIEYARKNPDNVAAAYLAKEYLLNKPDASVLLPLYDRFTEEVKQSIYGRQVQKLLAAANRTSIGSPAPLFEINDVNGKKISLASYKGKYTLVDFWASWCVPCRMENPKVLAAYQRFRDKGFDVISVSLDDQRSLWLKAIADDKLPWKQVCDLKGSNSPVKNTYGVKTIPMNFLLDKEGRIIAKDLRGAVLEQTLAGILK